MLVLGSGLFSRSEERFLCSEESLPSQDWPISWEHLGSCRDSTRLILIITSFPLLKKHTLYPCLSTSKLPLWFLLEGRGKETCRLENRVTTWKVESYLIWWEGLGLLAWEQDLSSSKKTAPRRQEGKSGFIQVCNKGSRQSEHERSGIKLRNLAFYVWEDPSLWAHWIHSFHRHFSSVQFSHSVVSNSLQPHGLQHTRLPCPSPTPGVYSNSCPLSQWCHPAISSSVVPFSSHLQSFPASGSFQMSQFFASGGQNIGVSASVSVLPMNIQDWFPLGWTGWIALQLSGVKSCFLVHHKEWQTATFIPQSSSAVTFGGGSICWVTVWGALIHIWRPDMDDGYDVYCLLTR